MISGHCRRISCKIGSVDLWLRTRTRPKMAPAIGARSISAKTSSKKCGGKGSPGIVQKGGGWGGVTDARTNSRNSQPAIDSNFLAIQYSSPLLYWKPQNLLLFQEEAEKWQRPPARAHDP